MNSIEEGITIQLFFSGEPFRRFWSDSGKTRNLILRTVDRDCGDSRREQPRRGAVRGEKGILSTSCSGLLGVIGTTLVGNHSDTVDSWSVDQISMMNESHYY